MEKLYVVHDDGSIVVVLKAKSKERAFDIFVKNQIEDELLSEEITTFIVNGSLLENFYKDDKGSFHDDYTGLYPERLQVMSDEERENYVEGWIEKNVRGFWSDQPQFAEEYLRELHKSYESEDSYIGKFSEEFMIDTIKRIIRTDKWYNDFDIVEVDLEGKEYQIIYDN